MNPLVSTIIPAHNAAPYLRKAVASLLRDAGHGIEGHEVIIVDDGSTDRTHDIAEELALNDDRVWVIRQTQAGVSAARNTGIEVARGQWLHFLDADDWMLEGGLSRLLEAAQRAGLEGACSGSALFGEDESPQAWRTGPTIGPLVREIGIADLLEQNHFQPGAMIVRRASVGEHRFDPSLACAEDWDMWLRLAQRGVRWGVVPGEAAAYRLRRAGASHRFAEMASSMSRVLSAAYERCRRNSIRIAPASRMRCEAMEASLRRGTLQQATAAALDDATPSRDGAFTVLVEQAKDALQSFAARELAEAAFWMLPFAGGRSPAAWNDDDGDAPASYLRAARAFWTRLERENVTAQGAADAAMHELAAPCVPPEAIAGSLVSRCEAGRHVTLIGLGSNAPHVVRALHASGIHCDARDDANTGAGFIDIEGVEIETLAPDAPFNPAAVHIVTISDDAAIIPRLPEGLDIRRWSVTRAELRDTALQRLTRLLSMPARPIPAAAQPRIYGAAA